MSLYDDRDRLTKVEDTTASGCVTRQYGFSLDSNRNTLTTSGPDIDGACSVAGAATETSSFDNADRIIGSNLAGTGYVYDSLGRTRTVPKVHTDQLGALASNLVVDYHSNDMVAKLSQTVPDGLGGSTAKTKNFTLDPSMRLSATSDKSAEVEFRKTVNYYADGGDAPAWIATETRPDSSTAWTAAWTRNVLGPDGDLALIQPNTGTPQIQIANLHGDIVAQVPNTTGAVAGIDAWAETTEYGLAKADGAPLDQNYGWLGTKRRSTDTVGGLTLMGVRLYNPNTGRFLSRDPIPGGNDNTYTYPADPINIFDLDGQWGWKKAFKIGFAVSTLVCSACAVAYGGYTAYKAYKHVKKKQIGKAAGEIASMIPGGAGRGMKALSKVHKGKATAYKTAKRYAVKRKMPAQAAQARTKQMHHLAKSKSWSKRSKPWKKRIDRASVAYDSYNYSRG